MWLRPKQRDSGDQSPQLRITKAGDRLLRSLLVRRAHYILGPFGPDTDLRRAGQNLRSLCQNCNLGKGDRIGIENPAGSSSA